MMCEEYKPSRRRTAPFSPFGACSQVSVRSAGEIDVAFAIDNQRYVLEAKWEQSKADTGDLAKLQRRVSQRFQGTIGLFLAMAGYSPDAVHEVDKGGRLEVLLLDRQHFEAMLSWQSSRWCWPGRARCALEYERSSKLATRVRFPSSAPTVSA